MIKNRYRRAMVFYKGLEAGIIEENKDGYTFTYSNEFIKNNVSISISLPVRKETYRSNRIFSFFTGLIPEGWYLNILCYTLKIDKNDVFGVLLASGNDTVGAVSVREIK